MVLKANPAAKFEDVTEGDEPVAVETAAADPAPATPTATVAPFPIAKAAPKLPAKATKLSLDDHDLLASLENRLPPVGFGEGIRLVGSNGNLMDGDKKVLGDSAKLTLLSWNMRWVVSPGTESDDKESKTLARYSTDGKFTSQGEDLHEYLKQLKADGYEKAAIKEYLDLFGVLDYAAKDTKHIGEPVTIALSPSSAKGFLALRRSIVVKGLTGKLPVINMDVGLPIKVSTEIKSSGSLTWTQLVCELDEDALKQAA